MRVMDLEFIYEFEIKSSTEDTSNANEEEKNSGSQITFGETMPERANNFDFHFIRFFDINWYKDPLRSIAKWLKELGAAQECKEWENMNK